MSHFLNKPGLSTEGQVIIFCDEHYSFSLSELTPTKDLIPQCQRCILQGKSSHGNGELVQITAGLQAPGFLPMVLPLPWSHGSAAGGLLPDHACGAVAFAACQFKRCVGRFQEFDIHDKLFQVSSFQFLYYFFSLLKFCFILFSFWYVKNNGMVYQMIINKTVV